ncbi:MAG: hypothetical protein IKO14_07885 [Oscillibacter sp.]|nr:hypothetical protein [Oscillibacter sp.]
MKGQSATYGKTRTDWSSEVKSTRAASDTGRGGMERDAESNPQNGNMSRGMESNLQNGNMSRGMESNPRNGTASRGMEQESWRGDPQSVTGTQDEWFADDSALSAPEPGGQWNGMEPRTVSGQELSQMWPNIENHMSNEEIEAPTTMDEVYRGSMKALLLRNVGNYVVATFLIGTQTTVSWEGILYDVGNDYLAIYQSGRDQYIVSDLYSLKYVEFYDTRRRELCDSLLTQQEPSGNAQRQ